MKAGISRHVYCYRNMNTYQACLAYIEDYWDQLTFRLPEDRKTYIALPNPFVAPTAADGNFAYAQFYWDSYFIILGLIASGRIQLAKGMVDNLAYLFEKFGIIPLRNRYYNLGISQIPFLTSMTLEVAQKINDTKWLTKMANIAEREVETRWLDPQHLSTEGLSRYCDHHVMHATAEHESGWDTTSRFQDRCLDYTPIDLNTCLYKYDVDLAQIYHMLGVKEKSAHHRGKAEERKRTIFKMMYDEKTSFFFDYNHKLNERSSFYSIAGFYPLWAGMVSEDEAKKIKNTLPIFEYEGGLANTQKEQLSQDTRQWDYPNGWPNQQWIVVTGLRRYGFREDAARIAHKWLDLNNKIFQETGTLWEKYDVVRGTIGASDRYPTQRGFGWTNAVFKVFCDDLQQS